MYLSTIISLLEVLLVVVPSLLTVAFVTIAERKTMASMQRRLGPNAVGWYGLLQAFADALKLLLKEYVSPTQANVILFFLGPIITLIFSLLGYAIVPYSPGLAILDFNLSILYALAVSSLATYGILLAGWSANSKYAFLGSLRSTAQLISYELILSSAILLVVLLAGSLSIPVIIESQKYIWFLMPLFPIFIIFFIGSVAETNRAPFDLAEAESELVSGFMTEHSAVIFVFFFLAEYASIVLICILTSVLFLGGYILVTSSTISIFNAIIDILNITDTTEYNLSENYLTDINYYLDNFYNNISSLKEGFIRAFSTGFKTCLMIFLFIWVRASFPRVRFDELMSYCWTKLLPVLIAIIIIVPLLENDFDSIPNNINILGGSALIISYNYQPKHVNSSILKKRSFSNTACFMMDEPSNNKVPSDKVPSVESLPELVESRARGKWDSSTAPDTVSDDVQDQFNKTIATHAKLVHDLNEEEDTETLRATKFVKTESNRLVSDYEEEEVMAMADKINNANQENAQGVYDKYYDQINDSYTAVREGIIRDQRDEIESLTAQVRDDSKKLAKELKEIEDYYKTLHDDNLNENSAFKRLLSSRIERDDLVKRGLDETNESEVEYYEYNLKINRANTSESDSSSVASLETHAPLDQSSSNKPVESPSENSEPQSSGNEPAESPSSGNESQSSNSNFQDSSDILPDYNPFDPFEGGE